MNNYNDLKNLFGDLKKSDSSIKDQFEQMSEEKSSVPKHVYKDSANPKVGNVYSYNSFLKQYPNSGVVLLVDINGFDAINQQFGHSKGNEVLKSISEQLAELVKNFGAKLFRKSGSTFAVHLPSPDIAEKFKVELINLVNAFPKVDGKFKLSASVGLGFSDEHAQKALSHSKNKLYGDVNGIKSRLKQSGAEDNVELSLLHENPDSNWSSLLGYDQMAPHEEYESLIDRDVKSPLKPYKG